MFGWSMNGQGLTLSFEGAMTCVESIPGLMSLQHNMRWTGRILLGHVDDAHAPFADLLQQFVWADDGPRSSPTRADPPWHGGRSEVYRG